MNLRIRSALAVAFVCILSSVLLSGCNGTSFGNDTISLAHYYLGSGAAHRVTYQQAAAVPYASLGFNIGDGPEFFVILASEGSGPRLWTSGNHMALITQKGRIVRTAGLGHDLAGLQLLSPTREGVSDEEIRFAADFPDIGVYSLFVTCHRKGAEPEIIQILGRSINTKRINEDCTANRDVIAWSFRNVYWVDAQTGFVWRSSQHVHPNLEAVNTEILRPPAD